MTLAPVPLTPAALRDALRRRGVDAVHADAAARGLEPVALALDDLSPQARDQVALAAHELGIACLTGDGWVLLAGQLATLAGLARPGGHLDDKTARELGAFLSGYAAHPTALETAKGPIPLDRPVIVGIVNVTPDSFSDGGAYLDPAAAVRHAERLIAEGADVLDIGAESTRPGRPDPVPADEEWRRLEPVVTQLAARFPHVKLSVDTVKATTARRALEAGAALINDVSGLRFDPEIADACAGAGAALILMHSRGDFRAIASYDHASYDDVCAEVVGELAASIAVAEGRGVTEDRLVVDPGFGFAKRPEHNLQLLQRLSGLHGLGMPIMVGPSRKRFLGAVTGHENPQARDPATATACALARVHGAHLFRVHNVQVAREALAVSAAMETA